MFDVFILPTGIDPNSEDAWKFIYTTTCKDFSEIAAAVQVLAGDFDGIWIEPVSS